MADYTNLIGAMNMSEGYAVGPSSNPTLALTSSLVLQNIASATVTSTVAAQTLTASSLVSGALFTASAGGYAVPVQTLTSASTGTAVTPYGITTIKGATSAGAELTFTLTAPVAGVSKVIKQLSPTTNAIALKAASATSITVDGSTNHVITFTSASTTPPLILYGLTSTSWYLGMTTDVVGVTLSGT
jgi:hypothetical protein